MGSVLARGQKGLYIIPIVPIKHPKRGENGQKSLIIDIVHT